MAFSAINARLLGDTDTVGGCKTVTVAVDDTAPEALVAVTVIVALPSPCEVTRPLTFTVATDSSELVHVTATLLPVTVAVS